MQTLSESQWQALLEWWCSIWPKPGLPLEQRRATCLERRDCYVHMLWDDEQLCAVASSFIRTVAVAEQRRDILALASVCSDPAKRGRGVRSIDLLGPEW